MLSRRAVLAGLLATPLAGCTSISPAMLSTLGTKVDTASVDFRALHEQAQRAHDSQKPEAEIRSRWPNVVQVGRIASVDVRYTLERDDQRRTQHLSMPGSLSLKDWLEDFDIFLKPDARDGMPLHRGFETSALTMRAEVAPLLRKDYTTYIAGYSMGAGVAAVLTLYLSEDGYRMGRTTTFGQPRVTNAKGAVRLAGLPLTRVVNADDFVSMVPTFPFEHFGEEVILHPGPAFVYLTHSDANQISIGEIWRQHHKLDLKPHASELYVARLAEKLAAATPVPYLQRLA